VCRIRILKKLFDLDLLGQSYGPKTGPKIGKFVNFRGLYNFVGTVKNYNYGLLNK
jgi:hypothetical protein